MAGPADTLRIADRLLEREVPGYTRNPAKKLQLIDWIGDNAHIPDPEAARRIAPYVADFDENVRFTAIEALELALNALQMKLVNLRAHIRRVPLSQDATVLQVGDDQHEEANDACARDPVLPAVSGLGVVET